MAVYTITYRAHTEVVSTPGDFPKCSCGGEFRITEYYTLIKRIYKGTTAVCKECGEFFCGSTFHELKESLPKYQQIRIEHGSIKEKDIQRI